MTHANAIRRKIDHHLNEALAIIQAHALSDHCADVLSEVFSDLSVLGNARAFRRNWADQAPHIPPAYRSTLVILSVELLQLRRTLYRTELQLLKTA